MLWLSRKTVFMNMLYTLNPWHLTCIGGYEFIVKGKEIVKLKGSDVKKYVVNVSTESGAYDSVISVAKDKYNCLKKGESIGRCSVIRNVKRDGFIVVVPGGNPEKAIKNVVFKSWGIMIMLLTVLALTVLTILNFICILAYS